KNSHVGDAIVLDPAPPCKLLQVCSHRMRRQCQRSFGSQPVLRLSLLQNNRPSLRMAKIFRLNLYSLPCAEIISNPVQRDVPAKFVLLGRREFEHSTVARDPSESKLDYIKRGSIVSDKLFGAGSGEQHTSVPDHRSDVLSLARYAQSK